MAGQLLEPLAIVTFVVALYVVVEAWQRRVAHLNLGLFRPYRKDPWPIGVQEDDDARFQWTPPAPEIELAAFALTDPANPQPEPTIEEIVVRADGAVPVRRVSTHAGDAFREREA